MSDGGRQWVSFKLSDGVADLAAGRTVNDSFVEIARHLLVPEDWQTVWGRPWSEPYQENILRTDAHALLWSLQNKLRRVDAQSLRHFALVDNLLVALGATTGRAGSALLLRPLRRVSGLLLASGARLAVRWVRNELNPADGPSRGHFRRRPGPAAAPPEVQRVPDFAAPVLRPPPGLEHLGGPQPRPAEPEWTLPNVPIGAGEVDCAPGPDEGAAAPVEGHGVLRAVDQARRGRQGEAPASVPAHRLPGLLEGASIRAATASDYARRLREFIQFCGGQAIDFATEAELDSTICLFF